MFCPSLESTLSGESVSVTKTISKSVNDGFWSEGLCTFYNSLQPRVKLWNLVVNIDKKAHASMRPRSILKHFGGSIIYMRAQGGHRLSQTVMTTDGVLI